MVASLIALPAAAAELPPIKSSESNRVPECATPGRLISYVRERNPKLEARYDGIASDYMRHGEALHIRWDYAFFQMLLETGYLTYKGDVKPEQGTHFAGLGATGKGARGESFKDVSTGVKAHLEHLLMYAGERVESPVAERTRNIQDWACSDVVAEGSFGADHVQADGEQVGAGKPWAGTSATSIRLRTASSMGSASSPIRRPRWSPL